MLWISDGRFLDKEKKGMNLVRKRLMCPQCRSDVKPDDERCPRCNMKLLAEPPPQEPEEEEFEADGDADEEEEDDEDDEGDDGKDD
jgi:DNA-directed RNA polymerase subunit RPC12/RpoP